MSAIEIDTTNNNEDLVKQTICVVGLGYVGLPTAACLAKAGFNIIGVDINPSVVACVNSGRPHIVEPGLEAVIAEVVGSGQLHARQTPAPASAYLITVPTPVGHDALRTPDLSYVFAAGDAIAPSLRSGAMIILESTSPVGTTRKLIERLAALRDDLRFPEDGRDEADVDVDIVYSPERILPGSTIEELRTNDRVVGGATPRAGARAAALYTHLTDGALLVTDDRSAEFVKLAENAFRDVNIAFANELSMVCDQIDLDVWEIIRLANHHPRVNILRPGPGVGGHCIAVDPWFIVAQSPERARLIRTAREVNDHKPNHVIAQIAEAIADNPSATIGCMGLTYKPDVDDFRESPSLLIARTLTGMFPDRVFCADPFRHALRNAQDLDLRPCEEVFLTADLVVMLVPHAPYRRLTRPGLVIDTCGVWK